MKEINVYVKCWQEGSGWKYTSLIDMIEIEEEEDIQEICNDYAKDYFQDQTLPEEEDYVIIFEDEDGDEICRSTWATELQNVD